MPEMTLAKRPLLCYDSDSTNEKSPTVIHMRGVTDMNILLKEAGMRICFRVNDDQTVELADLSAVPNAHDAPDHAVSETGAVEKPCQFLAVHVTGGSAGGFHAGKHDSGSVSRTWRYTGHALTDNAQGRLLTLRLTSPVGLSAEYFMQLYTGVPIVRTWAAVTNSSSEAIGLEYVSSFMYSAIGKDHAAPDHDALQILVPRNGWASEAQWQRCTAAELGLSHLPYRGFNLPDKGTSRFHYGSRDSWSTSEHLPVSVLKDPGTGEIFYGQIDHSGAWEIEYGGTDENRFYVCLLGPSDEAAWWKQLAPGQSFTTVPAAFGVSLGDVDQAFAALTRYRRAIRRPNEDNEKCHVVFNDYMNCLFADPTEEKEKPIIDLAASLGCEYYCLDAGWYDAGAWWDRVGEWRESTERFPNGLKAVYDYCRAKGMRMGMWLEIESMGTACELAQRLPDDWFICVHGKRRVENHRYLLDFRSPEVRSYCTATVDRLVADYGCEFFKIDYNVTTGLGSDVDSDSLGDAMLAHCRALHEWIAETYRRHPNLVIENCGSGGQRMDYGMLSLHSLQSTSDQTDAVSNAYIAANVATAVAPEQAGMWVYPYEDNREHVIFNMVNGLLLRPYVSGMVWKLSPENLALMREGISCYKRIRADVKVMTPFWPDGLNHLGDKTLTYGLQGSEKAFLAVFAVESPEVTVDLAGLRRPIHGARVIYPVSADCGLSLGGTTLTVRLPAAPAARLIELTF